MREIALAGLLVLLLPTVAAPGFGSYPVDIQKETNSLSTTFSIGIINPGDSTLEVELRTENSTEYTTDLPKTVEVEPSEVTESPSGSGWYSLGDGRYIEKREVQFRVEASSYSPEIPVPVTVSATSRGQYNGSISGQAVFSNSYTFRLLPDESLAPVGGVEDGENEEEIWKETGEEGADEGRETDNTSIEIVNGTEEPENYKQPENEESNGEGADKTTVILVMAIAALSIYVFRLI